MGNTTTKITDNTSLIGDGLSKNDDIDLSDSCKQNNNQSEIEEVCDNAVESLREGSKACHSKFFGYEIFGDFLKNYNRIAGLEDSVAKYIPEKDLEVAEQILQDSNLNAKAASFYPSRKTWSKIKLFDHLVIEKPHFEFLGDKSQSNSSASGLSDKSRAESGNQNYPEAQQIPCSSRAGSSRSHKNPFTAVNPLAMWNVHQPDTSTYRDQEEEGIEIIEEEVEEGFMEAEKYDGDKGKRPLSGKYSYKKRSKISQSDSSATIRN